MRDELSITLKSRGVRATLLKYREELDDVFTIYCRADRALAVGVADAAANGTMNLSELLILLKEAQILDERCTARAICTMFVKVNVDEMAFACEGSDGGVAAAKARKSATSCELDLEEFVEITARICDEKASQ